MTRCWLNGQLLDRSAALIPAVDPGFLAGDGVFTTTVVDNGRPFALDRNLRRLLSSLDRVGLPSPDQQWLRDGVADLLTADAVVRARLRVTVSAGTVLISHDPWSPVAPTATVLRLPWARNERGPLSGVKSTSFGDNMIGRRQLGDADEGLLGNTAGNLCEGLTSNVFLVIGGRLYTPPLNSGCLPGVTRELLCERLEVAEVNVPLAALDDCDEAFLTSAIRRVQPIGVLAGRVLPPPGELTSAAIRTLAQVAE